MILPCGCLIVRDTIVAPCVTADMLRAHVSHAADQLEADPTAARRHDYDVALRELDKHLAPAQEQCA